MLEAAVAYANRGWSVFPVHGKRQPLVDWKLYQSVRASPEQLAAWWAEHPAANIAVALGRISNIVRVDADGADSLVEVARRGGMPPTAEFTTGGGGRGWLFKHLDGLDTGVIWKGAGDHVELRVQSDGAYTVLPPSVTDAPYTWVSDVDPAPVPGWLRDYAVERALHSLVKELRPTYREPDREEIVVALQHIPADDYDQWVQVGMALKPAGDSYLEVWDSWSRGSPKYREGDCERKWASFSPAPGGLTPRSIFYWAEQHGYKAPNRHEPLTELGNARMLARIGDGLVLHSSFWGWLHWSQGRWTEEDAQKHVVELQKCVLKIRLDAAISSLNRHMRTSQEAVDYRQKLKAKVSLVKSIRSLESNPHTVGSRALAESEPNLSIDYHAFDQHPLLFNCVNGTVEDEL